MDEALILEKLDNLSNEIHTLKAGVLAELKQEMIPIVRETGPLVADCLSELDQTNRRDDLTYFMRNLVLNVETLNSLLSTAKGAMELKNEIEPIAKQVFPKAMELFVQLDGQIDKDELAVLLRNTIENIHNFNSALNMLKAGMEFKEEIEPIAKQILPKAMETFAQIDGHYDPDELAALFRNMVSNIHTFNSAIGLLKSGMELKEEIEPIAKLTLPKIIEVFHEFGGILKVAGTTLESLKSLNCSPRQADALSEIIRNIDFKKSQKIGPLGLLKKLNDPRVQEALGVLFTLLETMGALVESHRENA